MFDPVLILQIVGGGAAIWAAGFAAGKAAAWVRAIGGAV